MGGLSLVHILVVVLLVVLLFGSGKISSLMGDVAKGIKSFKKGLAEDEEDKTRPSPKVIEGSASESVSGEGAKSKDKSAN